MSKHQPLPGAALPGAAGPGAAGPGAATPGAAGPGAATAEISGAGPDSSGAVVADAVGAVERVRGRLAELDGLPASAHAAVYEDVHGVLQDALADLGRDSRSPAAGPGAGSQA